MPWQAIIILQNVFASAYALQSRTLATEYKNAHFQILAVAFSVLCVVFLGYGALNYSDVSIGRAAASGHLILAVALLLAVWGVLTFITLRYVDAALGVLYSVLNILAVVVVATLMLGEGLSVLQAIGAVLLLASIILTTNMKTTKKVKANMHIAIWLSIVASVAFGFAISIEKYVLDQVGLPTYAVFGGMAQLSVFLALALLYNRDQFKHFRTATFRNKVFRLGLIRAGAGLLFLSSMVAADNASLIGMLSGFKIILTTILAAIMLKEVMFIKRKIYASIIATAGVGMLLWP